jgi:cysteine-rich repeat protein
MRNPSQSPSRQLWRTLALALLILPSLAHAAVPTTLALEGALTSTGGGPVADGVYPMTFQLLDAQAGTAVWSEGPQNITVKFGQFTTALGGKTPLSPATVAGERWLQLQVATDSPLPTVPLRAVATALRASVAEGLECSGCIKAGQLEPTLLQGYAKTTDLAGLAKATDLSAYAKTSDLADYVKAAALAKVAATGAYADLSGTPKLADVATTGNYGDLKGLPIAAKVGASCGTGLVMRGIKADGSYECAAITITAAGLPKDGLDEVSNGMLTTQFTEIGASLNTPIAIADAFPAGTADDITVPDLGTAEDLQIYLDITNSDISKLKVTVYDPTGNAYVLYDKGGTGTALKTNFAAATKPVSGDLGYWTGKNPMGKWSISVADFAGTVGGKDGALNAWSIQVKTLSTAKVGVGGLLMMFRAASPPVDCNASTGGGQYFDTTTATLRYCDGKVWRSLADSCGNGVLEVTEECDDGNLIDNDGCSAVCSASTGYTKAKAGKSCLDILNVATSLSHTAPSAVLWIDPNGSPSDDAFQVWCDMQSDGGGWTLVMKSGDGGAHTWSTADQSSSGNLLNTSQPASNLHYKLSDAVINQIKDAVPKAADQIAVRLHESQTYNVKKFGKASCKLCTSYADACNANCVWGTDTYSTTPAWTNLSDGDDWKYYLGAANVGATRGFQRMSVYGRNSCAFHYGWVGDCLGGSLWVR